MKKALLICFAIIATSTFAQNGKAKLVEKVVKKGNELVIPYEKYVLDNGLIVIVHEDHSDPVCHVDVTYHVGSDREQVGRSGFAHFFEHMMFQGSDNVGDDQHFKIVSQAGGTLNGTTNSDRTNYFETLPANQMEIALWLEADRMGFLLDAVTQQKFEIQRATVKNERGQNYDNRPYGLIGEKVGEAMYPVGHPYSWQTIGYIEDLNRVDVNDLKKFFMRWYGPNNAVLTVAGDVNTAEVVKLAEKYFGPIPKGPEVKQIAKQHAVLDKDRYISYEDKIKFPLLFFAFPSVNNFHPDEAALDALSSILSDGKTSLFYQRFVKPQIAMQASVNNPCSEVTGQFTISVRPYAGKTLAQMDSLIRVTLIEFEKKGVTDDDLARFKATYEARVINSLTSVSGKASQLASYQTFQGNANYIQKDLDRYLKITKEDVMRVYKQYIKNKPAVILSVYPKGQSQMVAKPDNYQIPKHNSENVAESEEYKNLTYNKAKDSFDRSKQPAPGSNPVIKVPDFWKEKMPNGLSMIGAKNDEVPSVTIQLNIEAGHRFENKDKAGIAMLTANLMNEATTNHTAEQISDALDRLGSTIEVSSSDNNITMTISSLKKNAEATLKFAEEMLLHPKFDKEDFDRSKNEQLQLIADQITRPTVIANNVYSKLLYGENNIMSVPTAGIAPTVNSITLDDVKDYYNKNVLPNISELVIVGDINKDEALAKLSFLKNWKDAKVERNEQVSAPAVDKTKIYFVNKEKAPQSEIRIGYLAMPYDATGDYFRSYIMNYPLGMAFNSRINMNLREDKGWTYGARSGFSGSKYIGPYTASAGIKADATDSSIVEFIKEIKTYAQTGISDKELEFTKSSIGQSDALRYETPSQKAIFLKRILDYNLDKTFVDKQNEILKNITKAELDAVAKKHLPYERMDILIVGDKAKLYDRVSKLGYEVIELDSDGKPVKVEQAPVKTPDKELPNKK
jgi:zinc protease